MKTDILLVTAIDLETAEPGLYVMEERPGEPKTLQAERVYDFETDTFIDAPPPMLLMVRVREDDGRPLPKGVVDAWTRKDGRQVIKAYQAPPQD